MTTRIKISASELVASLSDVLSQVEAGTEYVVTRHGQPIAHIVPISEKAAGRSLAGAEIAAEPSARYTTSAATRPEGALAQLVSTPSLRRVLAVFLLEPAAEIHQREIARRAGVGLRSVQLALQRLVSLGLLAQRRDGNRLYYHAIRSERFEDVRELFAREFGIAEVIARHLGQLGASIRWAFIFGSAATGQDRVESDIDLVVVADASDDELVAPIAEAQRELGRDIDVVSYRPSEFSKKHKDGNHFIRSVLAAPRFDVIGSEEAIRT